VFVYARIADRRYGKACARILEEIAAGRLEAATTTLAVLEVARTLQRLGLSRQDVITTVHAILSLPIRLLPIDTRVLAKTLELLSSSGTSLHDCAHAAAALLEGISAIVTADTDFDRIPDITRIDPNALLTR